MKQKELRNKLCNNCQSIFDFAEAKQFRQLTSILLGMTFSLVLVLIILNLFAVPLEHQSVVIVITMIYICLTAMYIYTYNKLYREIYEKGELVYE